jgi:SagB-type dehydrogenase family enzyme
LKHWYLSTLQLAAQERGCGIAAQFHEHTKWTSYNISVESLRIRTILADGRKSGRFRNHGKSYFAKRALALSDLEASGSLQEAFERRRSVRNLSEEALGEQVLGGILRPVCERRSEEGIGASAGHRPFPSAGGLFPTEVYVLRRVGMRGDDSFSLYHVDAREKHLSEIRHSIARDRVSACLGGGRPGRIPGFGAAIFLTSVFARSTGKYGTRGYRFALLEAGHAAQNILLACAAIDLPCYCYGGYLDNEASELLNIDGVEEAPVHCILCGVSSDPEAGDAADI